ncbi:hypothetical protein GLYMA_13G052400v4 [Glycine max]|uniref:Uncharacterized protein n=1 Tax=Glycine max TaxID=3847 RepID=A0A0R0GVE7_SOYBN|nr:hypothetical protein GLYMA_13G052400v4 [Glycine max]
MVLDYSCLHDFYSSRTGGYQVQIIMCEQSFGEGYCYCCNSCQVYKEICRWGIYNLWYAGVQDLMPKYVFAVGDIHKAFHEFLMEGGNAWE